MSQPDSTNDREPIPTKEYVGPCPITGEEVTTEVACPEDWEVVELNPYSVTLERKSDGVEAIHSRAERDRWDDTLRVDGVEVLEENGEISRRDMVEHLSQL